MTSEFVGAVRKTAYIWNDGMVWCGIVEFNVPLDTVLAISETEYIWIQIRPRAGTFPRWLISICLSPARPIHEI